MSELYSTHIFAVLVAVVLALVYRHCISDAELETTFIETAGEVSSISGFVGRSDSLGSYAQVGEMNRFQDLVTKHTLNLNNVDVPISELRRRESYSTTF